MYEETPRSSQPSPVPPPRHGRAAKNVETSFDENSTSTLLASQQTPRATLCSVREREGAAVAVIQAVVVQDELALFSCNLPCQLVVGDQIREGMGECGD